MSIKFGTVTTTISGMESLPVLRQNLATAKAFVPMTTAEMQSVTTAVAPIRGRWPLEVYKTSLAFDHVVTRQMHGMPLSGANA